MLKRKFVAVAQLHENNNKDLIVYFEDSKALYAQIMRKHSTLLKMTKTLTKTNRIIIAIYKTNMEF